MAVVEPFQGGAAARGVVEKLFFVGSIMLPNGNHISPTFPSNSRGFPSQKATKIGVRI